MFLDPSDHKYIQICINKNQPTMGFWPKPGVFPETPQELVAIDEATKAISQAWPFIFFPSGRDVFFFGTAVSDMKICSCAENFDDLTYFLTTLLTYYDYLSISTVFKNQ